MSKKTDSTDDMMYLLPTHERNTRPKPLPKFLAQHPTSSSISPILIPDPITQQHALPSPISTHPSPSGIDVTVRQASVSCCRVEIA